MLELANDLNLLINLAIYVRYTLIWGRIGFFIKHNSQPLKRMARTQESTLAYGMHTYGLILACQSTFGAARFSRIHRDFLKGMNDM